LRKETDMKNKMSYPNTSLRWSQAKLRFKPIEKEEEYVEKQHNLLRKSYNDRMQRTYEDFEMETDDSVVEIDKEHKNN
jgi:hypothetical protein